VSDSSIDDRLQKLKKELDIMLGNEIEESMEQNESEKLVSAFGLSYSQAKAWLKREPKYIADDILQRKRTDTDFTEPHFALYWAYFRHNDFSNNF
jgi:hypothetical protein